LDFFVAFSHSSLSPRRRAPARRAYALESSTGRRPERQKISCLSCTSCLIKRNMRLSTDELLKAVGQLSQAGLEQFVSQIIKLRAQRQVHILSQPEAQLLVKINQGLPPEIQKRYDELIAKRREESLTPDEYDELLRLSDQSENMEALRMQYLMELAGYRKVSVTELMKSIRIRPPAHA